MQMQLDVNPDCRVSTIAKLAPSTSRSVYTMFATVLKRAGPARARVFRQSPLYSIRCVQTLAQNKSIYVHRIPADNASYALSYLPAPPGESPPAAILGHTTAVPPTPSSFTENPPFRQLLMTVLREYAAQDPTIRAEAYAAWSASMRRGIGAGAPSASERRGGGGGVGGFHNIVDRRVAGDVGMRGVPEPQDMLGVVGVDGEGQVVEGPGGFEECESWRVVTGDGVGVLTEYLEQKLVERLKQEKR
ncbi:hypothetical protein TWF696_000176 [Orbilia brochopaga]|uniref:Uncharacterized protein n=1 Tax=Orbilia brochopaga TaxID=3140254 RepID=A0AAV9VAX0_9PEZI